jgi:hypothetical protein
MKPLKSTGGDGVLITDNYGDTVKFKRQYRSKHKLFNDFFIYEEFKKVNIEASAQFLVLKRPGEESEIKFLSFTKQIINKVSHEGNILTNDVGSKLSHLIPKNKLNNLKMLVKGFADKNGYKGYVGVDFGITKKGESVIFEFNSRITGSTYPLLVLRQLERHGFKKIYIATSNSVKPKSVVQNTDQLLTILKKNKLLFDLKSKKGLIPTLVTTLPKKVGFVSVGKTEREALKFLENVKVLLSNKHVK